MQQSCILAVIVCQGDASILLLSLDMQEMFINELRVSLCFLPTLLCKVLIPYTFVFRKEENQEIDQLYLQPRLSLIFWEVTHVLSHLYMQMFLTIITG